MQGQLKLANPQPKPARSLKLAGMNDFFEIYAELDAAVASFG